MIGQRRIKNIVKQLNKLPQFIIVSGAKGSGKSLFIDELCKYRLNCVPQSVSSIDDIRYICEKAVDIQQDTAYVLDTFDSVNFRTKEAILKLCEETPEHIYIFIETQSVSNLKQTLLSRAFLFELDAYSKEDLINYCMSLDNITDSESETLMKLFNTPGNIYRASLCGAQAFTSFCAKVASFINDAPFGNALKISSSLKLKSDSGGYDLDLFFDAVAKYALEFKDTLGIDVAYNIIKACSDANTLLASTPTINKQMLFDTWLMNIHGI